MSRETDSSSAGRNGRTGRGGAAYPSGTPPYGTPMASEEGAEKGRGAARPDERKTETTLTTRIRINIPGSRPIPPVVMRTPVSNDASAAADGAEDAGQGPAPEDGGAADPGATGTMRAIGAFDGGGASGGTGTAEFPALGSAPGQAPAPAEEKKEKASDWFAPRKAAATPTAAGGSGASGNAGTGGNSKGQQAAGQAGPTGSAGSTASGGVGRAGSGGGKAAGLPGATGAGPVAPGHGGGTGSFDVSAALAAAAAPRADADADGPATGAYGPDGEAYPSSPEDTGSYAAIGGGEPYRGEPYGGEPYGGEPFGDPYATGSPEDTGSFPAPGALDGGGPHPDDLPYFSQGGGPAGPTTGPVTGDTPLAGLPVRRAPGTPAAQGGQNSQGGLPGRNSQDGRPGQGALPGGGLSDDTAVLTPQHPMPGGPGHGAGDNVSGHTLTSGIPVVPADGRGGAPFGPGGGEPSGPHTPPKLPDAPQPGPSAQSAGKPAKSAAKPAKKKGRRKLPLLIGVLVFAGGVAYGAGLLMNRSDVPKGTTVLGVDIGGGTRDEAVQKLDAALGDRTNKAMKLAVDGDTVSLKPDQAGLQFDSKATVADAAHSDYNPVSVVGSLFGQKRVVEPVMPVDEEKLRAALEQAAGTAGANDGTIRFKPGKAVPVYGRSGQGIDVAKSTEAVQEAYRNQVETGTAATVKVPTTAKEPTVSKAEVDREMKAFAEPAMSGLVTVKTADGVHQVSFSPQNSLWKFLRVKAVDGKLVDYYDRPALKKLYGEAFDTVLITRGSGQKTAVTVEDVINTLRPALLSRTNRVAVIDTTPN
ncbi:hypothetical protein [Streptomyces sp. B3I8]|uniref:hypothetical protein n=1 Tax=Streptomyces sp. B3I8 TaxID=3042303 RepID=UPI0027D847CD|nr:hypothetical protein [Streptomyces sp. B3I8]